MLCALARSIPTQCTMYLYVPSNQRPEDELVEQYALVRFETFNL